MYATALFGAGQRINLFLAKKLGVPRLAAIRICRALKLVLHPAPYLKRRSLLKAAEQQLDNSIRIAPDTGYARVDPKCLPALDAALEEARAVYQRVDRENALERYDSGASRKGFLVYAAQGNQAAQYPAIMKLALSRPIIDAVTRYLGSVPSLTTVDIMISLPNESEIGSQLYHLDFADERQVKWFICIDEVTDEHGPFTFLPIPESNRMIELARYDRGRIAPEEVEATLGKGQEVSFVGRPGDSILVDTSSCLHFGSRKNSKRRVMLVMHYRDYYAPDVRPALWPTDRLARDLHLDPVQRMVVTL